MQLEKPKLRKIVAMGSSASISLDRTVSSINEELTSNAIDKTNKLAWKAFLMFCVLDIAIHETSASKA
jgi:hypothetical protein